MPLEIVRNDITKMKVDAIVNAANRTLLGGGGVDGAIHRAAGPGLLRECLGLGGCGVGKAKITGAYRLPCQYVIHTVGPIWRGGRAGEKEKLVSCYQACLELAKEKECQTVAFPLISSGAYGYPKDQALKVAIDVIGEFLLQHDMTVFLVVYDKTSYQISGQLFRKIAEYIDDTYVETHTDESRERSRNIAEFWQDSEERRDLKETEPFEAQYSLAKPAASAGKGPTSAADLSAMNAEEMLASLEPVDTASIGLGPGTKAGAGLKSVGTADKGLQSVTKAPAERADTLEEALKRLDESFSEMLLRKIDEQGMTDAQCYKRANIDRKLFSKIRSDRLYRPSKPTVLAFAVALELPLEETRDMLMKAGYALSHSNKFDIIVEFFIKEGNYNIFEINEALFAFDQRLLGA